MPENSDRPVFPLSRIGWDTGRNEQLSALGDRALEPARVARIDGRTSFLITADGDATAELATDLLSGQAGAQSGVAVGDWVALRRRTPHGVDLIEKILKRRTRLIRARRVMKASVETQVVAANIDAAFIV